MQDYLLLPVALEITNQTKTKQNKIPGVRNQVSALKK